MKFCISCGKEYQKDQKFCGGCGKAISKQSEDSSGSSEEVKKESDNKSFKIEVTLPDDLSEKGKQAVNKVNEVVNNNLENIKSNQVIQEATAATHKSFSTAKEKWSALPKQTKYILAGITVFIFIIAVIFGNFTEKSKLESRANDVFKIQEKLSRSLDQYEIRELATQLLSFCSPSVDSMTKNGYIEAIMRAKFSQIKSGSTSDFHYRIVSVDLNDAKNRGVVSYHQDIKNSRGEMQKDSRVTWIKINGQWYLQTLFE